MAAVSNTTPVNYLVLIDAVDLLPQLYERIRVPQTVLDQLLDDRTPARVRGWASRLPTWVDVVAVTAPADPSLDLLHPGEREAIVLAQSVVVRQRSLDGSPPA